MITGKDENGCINQDIGSGHCRFYVCAKINIAGAGKHNRPARKNIGFNPGRTRIMDLHACLGLDRKAVTVSILEVCLTLDNQNYRSD